MAYVYRHIRLDNNKPFYIGIGITEGYKRAYSEKDRNKYWKNIVDKAPYEVEIMLDNLTWEEACEKEIEFITLYGRKDLNEGTLVNMTSGGDGVKGKIMGFEQKNKISLSKKGHECYNDIERNKKISKALKGIPQTYHIESVIKAKSIPVLQYNKQGNLIKEWFSGKEAARTLKLQQAGINGACKGKYKSAGGFIWKYKNEVV